MYIVMIYNENDQFDSILDNLAFPSFEAAKAALDSEVNEQPKAEGWQRQYSYKIDVLFRPDEKAG